MPTVLSVTMAVGARLLAKKKAIVSRLVPSRVSRRGRALHGQDRHLDREQLTLGEPFALNGVTPEQSS